jgi:hypothetical protein
MISGERGSRATPSPNGSERAPEGRWLPPSLGEGPRSDTTPTRTPVLPSRFLCQFFYRAKLEEPVSFGQVQA